jgi:iron complex outermembrane recepter protein
MVIARQSLAGDGSLIDLDLESLMNEEVVVTAQKRTEIALDVPSSISVLGAGQLETLSALQLVDYATFIPGFDVATYGSPAQAILTLRGLSPLGGPETVGTYIDDAPFGPSGAWADSGSFALDLLPYDFERVEVLRGPQGTLYGANTMGGLLKFVTRAPDLHETYGRVGIEASSIESAGDPGFGLRATANLPVIEGKLALRASYFDQQTPGYVDNLTSGIRDENDATQQGGRFVVLWQPSQNVSVKVSALLQDVSADDGAVVPLHPETHSPLVGDLANAHFLPQPYAQKTRFYNASVNWDLGQFEIASTSSYATSRTNWAQDVSAIVGVQLPLLSNGAIEPGLSDSKTDNRLKKYTQEFRLTSPAGKHVDWLVGAFFTTEDSDIDQRVSVLNNDQTPVAEFDPVAVAILPSIYREYALFGDFTYKLTERFDVTAGVRWARNEQTTRQISGGALFGETVDVRGRSSENVTTYMLSPRLHLTDNTLIYGRFATGYRPGGPNISLPDVAPSFAADTLMSYELGLKSEWLSRRVLLDLAVFHIDWDDIQLNLSNGRVSYLSNGGTARSQGVELTAAYAPVESIRLGLTLAHTDAVLAEDTPSLSGARGARLPFVSKLGASMTADYQLRLRNDWSARAGLAHRYVGDQFSEVASSPSAVRAPSYRLTDFNLSLFNERWTARLFVKNATNARAYVTPILITDVFGAPLQIDTSIVQPRTLGISLEARF